MSLDPGLVRGLRAVRVVGTGLLGTSIALALRQCGIDVLLADPSPTALALARDVGAGVVDPGDRAADLVVVAAPPDVTSAVVADELDRTPGATVTDVASVKAGVLADLARAGADLTRYVGGHPMAGRERSGPIAARSDLFVGRPWVVCPAPEAESARVDVVRRLVAALGASPVELSPGEHDAAVALVSHLPQVAASLVAARLAQAPATRVGLAGQGLRDVTRIAGSDPTLWAQILSANAVEVRRLLVDLRDDLDGVVTALDDLAGGAGAPGARAALARLVASGNAGRDRIPGKHGEPPTAYAVVTVLLPDRPGQLARLFSDIGDADVNVEEFSLEHAPGQAVGLASVSVLPGAVAALTGALEGRGWHVLA